MDMNYLEYVLKKTDGALFVRIDNYAALVGISRQTARNQISNHTFPLPIVRIGRCVFVKALDLANFLETGVGQTQFASSPRRPGRPRKYPQAQRAAATKKKNERAIRSQEVAL